MATTLPILCPRISSYISNNRIHNFSNTLSFTNPLLKPSMTCGTRTRFFRKHLPLASSSQHIQYTVKYFSKRYNWTFYCFNWLFSREYVLYFILLIIWNMSYRWKVMLFLFVTPILYKIKEH